MHEDGSFLFLVHTLPVGGSELPGEVLAGADQAHVVCLDLGVPEGLPEGLPQLVFYCPNVLDQCLMMTTEREPEATTTTERAVMTVTMVMTTAMMTVMMTVMIVWLDY